jgi:hypothetical protein
MRMTTDEALVARLASSAPVASVLGRLPSTVLGALLPGCPLLALSPGGPPANEDWRGSYPPIASSLYVTLEFLRTIDQQPFEGDAYAELLERRSRTDIGVAGPMLDR